MKIKFKRLDHVQICIPQGEEEQARNFYVKILGLSEIEKPEYLKKRGGFWLQIGNIQLHIGVEKEIHRSKRHPAFVIEDFEKVKSYLIANNVDVKEDEPIPGFNRFSFFDPFRNRIELLQEVE